MPFAGHLGKTANRGFNLLRNAVGVLNAVAGNEVPNLEHVDARLRADLRAPHGALS